MIFARLLLPLFLPVFTLLVLYVYHNAKQKITEKYTSEWGTTGHFPSKEPSKKLTDGSQEEEMSTYVKGDYEKIDWSTQCNQNNETCYDH